MSITAVQADPSGRIIAWDENGYSFTVAREVSGAPIYVRGRASGKAAQYAEFKYTAYGAFTDLVGEVRTDLLPNLVSEAQSRGDSGGGSSQSIYAGPAASGNNDTEVLQEFFDDMAATALTANRQLKLILPPNGIYLMDGLFLRSNLDIDLNGSTLKKVRDADYTGAGALTARSAILRAPLQKNGNTWYGAADNFAVRNGTLDANNRDTLAVLDLYNVRNFLCDGLTLITSQWSRNWATRGGGYATFLNGRILGSAGLYQDGGHWQYGGSIWDNWEIHSGDDGLAAGDDAVSANVYMDDQGLDYFIARNIRVLSARGAAAKVYTSATKPFSAAPNNYTKTGKVKGVDIQVTGKSGLLRNGGVSVFSHAAPGSRKVDDLSGVRVHAELEVGTAGNAVWDAVSGVIVGSPTNVTRAAAAVVSLAGHNLPAGKVVHLMPDPGGMNTLNGFHQVMADGLTTDTFQLSDIAYRNSPALNTTGAPAWTTGKLVAVGSGTGYAVGDELTPAGGTYVRQAKYLVTQVDANGAVEAVRRLDEGNYSVLPATPNTPTGGSGTGCTLQLFLVHDGVNAFGVKSYAGQDAAITGRILINDTTHASAPRFRPFMIVDSEAVNLKVFYPKLPNWGGYVMNESALQMSKKNVIHCRMICNGALVANESPIMLLNSADTVVSGSIEELPSNTSAVAFPIGGASMSPKNIAGITGDTNSSFDVAHFGWKAGQIVRISGNVLSSGSLDGHYIIRRVFGDTTFYLRALAGAQVGLAGATVTQKGTIELANNTAKITELNVSVAQNSTGTIGVQAANTAPHRVTQVTIADCNFLGVETPINPNVAQAPMGYVNRDNRV